MNELFAAGWSALSHADREEARAAHPTRRLPLSAPTSSRPPPLPRCAATLRAASRGPLARALPAVPAHTRPFQPRRGLASLVSPQPPPSRSHAFPLSRAPAALRLSSAARPRRRWSGCSPRRASCARCTKARAARTGPPCATAWAPVRPPATRARLRGAFLPPPRPFHPPAAPPRCSRRPRIRARALRAPRAPALASCAGRRLRARRLVSPPLTTLLRGAQARCSATATLWAGRTNG